MVPTCSTLIAPTLCNLQLDYRLSRPISNLKSETPVRISLACMTCRSRKVRCNGESPCSSCLGSNRDCFFDQAKSKRRRKSSTTSKHSSHEHYKFNKTKSPSIGGISHTNSSEISEDHPSSQLPNPTRIPYFRFLGPTAIAPGAPFREISLKLVRESAGSKVSHTQPARPINNRPITLPTALPSTSISNITPAQLTTTDLLIHDKSSFNLTEEQFRRNADVFYDNMGSYLGCIRKEDLLQSLSQGKASEALKLAISALAECIHPSSSTVDYPETYSRRAKLLCLPHLSLPSLDTTFTLLLLAYCEFAREKDSGLWMWSGLAFRMATDLGLHKSSSIIQTHQDSSSSSSPSSTSWDQSEAKLRQQIFWCCYHLDRLISSGTGRVVTLLDSEIEIDLPPLQLISHEDPPLQTPNSSQEPLLSPFHHLTQILILAGKISDAFNRSKLAPHSFSPSSSPFSEPQAKTLEIFRTELHDFYTRLPSVLHFTVDIARRHIGVKNGPAFLLLHLWFHSLVIITHNPNSVGPGWSSLDVGPMEPLLLEMSQGSVRTISDMIVFTNVIDPDIVPSLPFASQPILIAGLASIPNHRNQSPNAADWREFEVCSAALCQMQTRWRGVGWLVSTLHSRARNEQDVDLSSSGGAEVSTADNSLMNKLLVKKSEPESLNPISLPHSNQSHHFVGLSATGTFHEPASGRLSLVHQPEIFCSASTGPAHFNNHHQDQKWAGGAGAIGQPTTNRLGRLKLNGRQEDEQAHGRSNGTIELQEHPTDLGPTLDSTDYSLPARPAVEPNHQSVDNFSSPMVAKETTMLNSGPQSSSASSYWVTQPIPQIFWPNLPSLEVLSHHKPGGPTLNSGPTDENHHPDKDPTATDQPVNLGTSQNTTKRVKKERDDFQTIIDPFALHSPNYHPPNHQQSLHILQPLNQHHPPPTHLEQQQQQQQQQQRILDHIPSLPQFLEHHPHSHQPPSPVFDKEVWDHLFRGEVGIWSSFHHL